MSDEVVSLRDLTKNRFIETSDGSTVGERSYVTYNEISQLPKIKIVRCSECKHFDQFGFGEGPCCSIWGPIDNANHFCSDGVEKSDAT